MLHVSSTNICILSVDRYPTGNFVYFLNALEYILNILYANTTEFIICSAVNINYLNHNCKKQLDGTVYFPTRIQTHSSSAIDSIFIG